jgi:two-component system sensor histidine kinase VicK
VGGVGLFTKVGTPKTERINSDFILEAIQDGVVMVGHDNTIQLFNPAAATISGWLAEEAIGLDYQSVLKLVDPKGQPIPIQGNPFAQSINAAQSVRDNNLLLMAKTGKSIAISLIVSPVFDKNGRAGDGVVGVFRDISKEKEEEAHRSDFISTASHEMRTPLAAIEGYLALSLNQKTAIIDDHAKRYLEKASASTKHLGELFRDLLTSSKAEDGRLINYPAVVEIGEILEQVSEASKFHAKEKNLALNYIISADQASSAGKAVRPLYYTYVDPNRIREVFQNLIDNALKYTMNGQIDVRLTGDNSIIQIQIKDSGLGIAVEDIPHLFQKFYRVDNSTTRTVGGTGLGLFICRKIVELYNGRIWVESEIDKGSIFFINLPRLNSEQALEIQRNQASTVSPLDPH